MVNFCVKCYTGIGCSLCYIVISVWGFLFFGIFAILFHLGKQGNISKEALNPKDCAVTCLVGTIFYFVLLLLCIFNFCWRSKHPFPKEDEVVDSHNEFASTTTSDPIKTELVEETK